MRKSHNYTQAQIAKMLNVTRQTVSKWEMGISEPSLYLLSKLADIYNCSVDELLDRKNVSNTPETHVEESQTENEDKPIKPFWTIDKEASFVVSVGIVISLIYFICSHYYPLSIIAYLAIECPIYIVSIIITVCSDERIKTKGGMMGLILPLLLVIVAQIALGLIMEH